MLHMFRYLANLRRSLFSYCCLVVPSRLNEEYIKCKILATRQWEPRTKIQSPWSDPNRQSPQRTRGLWGPQLHRRGQDWGAVLSLIWSPRLFHHLRINKKSASCRDCLLTYPHIFDHCGGSSGLTLLFERAWVSVPPWVSFPACRFSHLFLYH